MFDNQDQKYQKRIQRVNLRYDKNIQEFREYFKKYKNILARENFKHFLQIRNKRVLEFQIENRRIRKKVNSQFLKVYEEKLDLERELSILEETTNTRSESYFANIEKEIERITRNSDDSFSKFNLTPKELQSIYFTLGKLEDNLDFFDETFNVLRRDLLLKVTARNLDRKNYVQVPRELWDFATEDVLGSDRFETTLRILGKMASFKASLVSL